jgi:hypothetical protein
MSSSPEPPASISRQPHDQQVLFQSEGISMISLSTFAALAVVVIGGGAVSFMSWRNAQATSSVAQLLYITETTPPR